MSVLTKIQMAVQLLRWKRHWTDHDNNYKPSEVKDNPKFKTGREAAAMVPDGACVASSGITVTMRASMLYWAVRDHFRATGHPRGLTWIIAGGGGGRGKVPGTADDLAEDGLVTRFISAHHETMRAMLRLADAGKVELAVLPQGRMCRLIEAQGHGELSQVTGVGVGTFIDPRVGSGTQVEPGKGEQLVEVEGEHLRFRLPAITAAAVPAHAADTEGNVYVKNCPSKTEILECARAARRNGGVVLVQVAEIIPKDEAAIFLRADEVDGIVVYPRAEVTCSIFLKKPWPELLPGSTVDVGKAMVRMKALNDLLKLDPARGAVENSMARQCAAVFASAAHPGAHTLLGYGLPQEVGRLVQEGGLGRDVKFLIETGVYGGIPGPGLFFGSAVNPEKLITSAEMFAFCEKNLDATILGMLQVDAEGNVNVSKKAPGVRNYIGPGGFIDLVTFARNILFIGQWMARADVAIEGGKMCIRKPGIPKFVGKVDEVTFWAKGALQRGQNVYYVTNVGTFRLTPRGLELFQVAPGIDVQRDILDSAPDARIVLPTDREVEVLDRAILTGEGFQLRWAKAQQAPRGTPPDARGFASA